MIRFGEDTEDEVFISHEAATQGIEIENSGSEPLVGLRYFGPDTFASLPAVGDYLREHAPEPESASRSTGESKNGSQPAATAEAIA